MQRARGGVIGRRRSACVQSASPSPMTRLSLAATVHAVSALARQKYYRVNELIYCCYACIKQFSCVCLYIACAVCLLFYSHVFPKYVNSIDWAQIPPHVNGFSTAVHTLGNCAGVLSACHICRKPITQRLRLF
jgi:hypothetical protein